MTATPVAPGRQAPDGYPAHWEADILLADGKTARLRPLRLADEETLDRFWSRLSFESQYFRFFMPRPVLREEDKERFLRPDHSNRVVQGVFVGPELIAIGEFTRTSASNAELAFAVEDAYHGYGVGGLLLEHLAQAARELGITQLTAEVLKKNVKMLKTLRAAGYEVQSRLSGDELHCVFPVEPTEVSLAVMAAREHRAEANSMRRIFEARTVAVVGGSSRKLTTGRRLLSNVIAGEFDGRVYVVNPAVESALGLPSFPSVRDIPDTVDLAVIAVPADRVPEVIADCAAKQVHAVLVVSLGYAEAGEAGRARQAALLEQCRTAGIRLIGPCALGVLNQAGNSLNASMCDVRPQPGPIGFFCQSGPLSLTSLRMLVDRGLGLSTFVSAGNRADVSGNDLLQYWEQDEQTEVILCYLESLGNPHKFSRVARRISARKPVIAMTAGPGSNALAPLPEAADSLAFTEPVPLVEAMLRQSGVIQVEHVEHLFDVAQFLVHQPLPRGNRLAIVGDSPELTIITSDVARRAGFQTQATWLGLAALSAAAYEEKLRAAMEDEDVDAVLAVFVPAPTGTAVQISEVRAAIAALAGHRAKPLFAVIPGGDGDPNVLRLPSAPEANGPAERGSVPIYRSPERAILALRKVRGYAVWRAEAESPVTILHDVSPGEAAVLLSRVLDDDPQGRDLHDDELTQLLAHYGVPMLPYRHVDSLPAAVAAAEDFGWNVVLKATADRVGPTTGRRVWPQIIDEHHMAIAWSQLTEAVGDPTQSGVVVQAMGGTGLRLTVTGVEDRMLGPVVSCRIAGVASQILGDVSYRLPPLTRADISSLLTDLRLAPMLFGGGDFPLTDVAAVEDVICRLAALKQNQPDVASLEVDILAHEHGISVIKAHARVLRPEARPDLYARRLSAVPDGV